MSDNLTEVIKNEKKMDKRICEDSSPNVTMSRRLLCYIFTILLSKIGPYRLRKELWRNRKIRVVIDRKRYDQGTVYVNPILCITKGVLPYQIVRLTFSYTTKTGTRTVDRLIRLRTSFSIPPDEVHLDRNDYFNIFGRAPVENVQLQSLRSFISLSSSEKVLEKCDTIKLAEVKQLGSRRHDNCENELRSIFTTPRIFYKHDYLCVNSLDTFTGKNLVNYYRVDCTSPGIVNSATSVYELISINSPLPYAAQQSSIHLPSRMKKLLNRMRDIYFAHSQESEESLVFLLSGTNGSGKRLLVNTLASATHQNVLEMSCYELWSEIAAQAENKLKNAFEKAKAYIPCILHLTAADVLGFDPNSNVVDQRIVSTLRQLLKECSQVTVVLSCSNDQLSRISARVRSLALYELFIEHLDEDDRKEFFKCYFSDNIAKQAARQTSGFVISELLDVIKDAKFNAQTVRRTREITKSDIEWAVDKRNASFADSIGAPKIPTVSWSDVGGLEDTKEVVVESIEAVLHSNKKCPKRSGIILFGPPGCGKTLIAKAVATEFKIAFLSVKGPELLNKYVGQSEENLRKVFERARQASPCVIFFDELDSLAPNRGKSGDSGGVMDRIVSQLLSELDSLHNSSHVKVFVMAATNRADLLDPSLLTPGRFDKVINVSPGRDTESKRKILEAVSRSVNLAPDVDLHDIASRCSDVMSGAEMYSLVSTAAMESLREQVGRLEAGLCKSSEQTNLLVSRKHLEAALQSWSEKSAF